jgi:hypothetical protein
VRSHAYDSSKSSTAGEEGSDGGSLWQVQYGGGGVRGAMARDSVQLFLPQGALAATNVAFAVATDSWKGFDEPQEDQAPDDGIFSTLKGDGVLGMAFKSLNSVHRDKQATLMDHLVEQGQLRTFAFAVYLASGGGFGSFVAFGSDAATINLTG